MHRRHFFLSDNIAEIRDYRPWTQGGGKNSLPQRDILAHGTFVKEKYVEVVNEAVSCLDEREAQGFPVAKGVYVDLKMDKNFVPDSLGKPDGSNGATLMKVTDKGEEDKVDVTVYVKKDKKDWLAKKADDYVDVNKNTKKGAPSNEKIIAPIEDIACADIRSLYVSPAEFDAIPNEGVNTYELWLTHSKENNYETTREVLAQLGIAIVAEPLVFDGVDVWLFQATKQQLYVLPLSLGYIEGIRPYRMPSILLNNKDQNRDREWVDLIYNEISYSDDADKVQVCILDSGVNNEHKLLKRSLPNERMDVAIGVMDTTDHKNHGTGMAGLVLFGDLTNIIHLRNTPVELRHALSSVKIYEKDHATPQEFYGAVLEEAVNKASNMSALISCMAVTDQDSYEGMATSSSAALDESIYHQGKCDRLVLVSAGNVQPEDVDHENYLGSCKANAIQSPAQAWNALTVGAYTEKTALTDTSFEPIAAPGGVSPYSRSSYPWNKKRTKPEIVMEGGNVAYHSLFKETQHPDLDLVTCSNDLREPLEAINATSAATGLAARLAARIKAENPDLSMLSIRGLMVHSAQWTEEMGRIKDVEERMSLCGYGAPNEDKAIYSNERSATYIFENTLVPYKKGSGGDNSYNQWHFYDLPWPQEVLADMGKEDVTIRITLSYYVKPSPGYVGRTNPYRYPSATLHFDLKNATETTREFLGRRNKNDGEKTTQNDSSRWTIKQLKRERGTVQSDWIKCSAAALAEMNQIVVYPGQGWWKERKLENVDNSIPYSLIVSIETAKTDIYNAVETAISNRIGIRIVQGI